MRHWPSLGCIRREERPSGPQRERRPALVNFLPGRDAIDDDIGNPTHAVLVERLALLIILAALDARENLHADVVGEVGGGAFTVGGLDEAVGALTFQQAGSDVGFVGSAVSGGNVVSES